MTIRSALWQTVKLSKKKTAKVLVVTYSGGLNAGATQNLGAYHLVTAGKDKKLGTKDDKTVPLTSATYNAAANTVTLTTKGKVPSGALQLDVNPTLVLDAEQRPIREQRHAEPGQGRHHPFQRVNARSLPAAEEFSAEAVDGLLVIDQLPAARGRWRGR